MKMDVFSSVHVYDVYIIFQKTKSLLTGIIPSTCSHSNVTIACYTLMFYTSQERQRRS